MHTIVALGNPGAEYEDTRHNAGRVVLREVLKAWGWPAPFPSAKLGGAVAEGAIGGVEARVFFPDTYMNHSGRAVKKIVMPEAVGRLIVVYDEVDLPFGEFKLSFGRGAGGHNGLSSVIEALGTPDFMRVRIGIAPTNWLGRMVRPRGDRLADYVLGKLTAREEKRLLETVPRVAEALQVALKEGKEKAMNRFN